MSAQIDAIGAPVAQAGDHNPLALRKNDENQRTAPHPVSILTKLSGVANVRPGRQFPRRDARRHAFIWRPVMSLSQSFTRSLALSCLAVVIVVSAALAEKFEQRVGQPGKDVVWVPSPQALVDRMLDIAKLTPNDFHMDLGSGDGRTVITAAKRGATAVGVEFNPNMVNLARENAKAAGVSDRATFIEGDLFQADISKANVITLFLLPDINLRLRPKILDLRPGTRVVSNSFDMGDWTPDQTIQAGPECTSWCRAHLWIVPAKVQGTWKLPDGG